MTPATATAGMGSDVLVIGSGVAGLSAAIEAARSGLRVTVVSKAALDDSATRWAQGGVAAYLPEAEAVPGLPPDSAELHFCDTLAAGAGLVDEEAVGVLVTEGPDRVRWLLELGAVFDRVDNGSLALAREGGHSTARVVHAGGAATGAEVERALLEAARRAGVEFCELTRAIDLVVEGGRCAGVVVADQGGARRVVRADNTVLATGGSGQLFSVTTNPAPSTGDGIAMALRAGVAVADVEFVQFHPTALHAPAFPRPLLTEALRGEGALLFDPAGRRFVDELAPRDVVSKAMTSRMLEAGEDHVWLDATGIERFSERFPTIAAALWAAGLDPQHDRLPVAPAAHYLCGGMLADLDGATSLPGLWAVGETACSGVHGANRLASNSLLEGLVFALRALRAIGRGKGGPDATGALGALLDPELPAGRLGVKDLVTKLRPSRSSSSGGGNQAGPGASARRAPGPSDHASLRAAGSPWRDTGAAHRASAAVAMARDELQVAMTTGAGVLRDAASLRRTAGILAGIGERLEELAGSEGGNFELYDLRDLLEVADATLGAATAREESRGCHGRTDFPATSSAFSHRFVCYKAT